MALEELNDFVKNGVKSTYQGENEDFFLGTSDKSKKKVKADINKESSDCEIKIDGHIFKLP